MNANNFSLGQLQVSLLQLSDRLVEHHILGLNEECFSDITLTKGLLDKTPNI